MRGPWEKFTKASDKRVRPRPPLPPTPLSLCIYIYVYRPTLESRLRAKRLQVSRFWFADPTDRSFVLFGCLQGARFSKPGTRYFVSFHPVTNHRILRGHYNRAPYCVQVVVSCHCLLPVVLLYLSDCTDVSHAFG